VIVRYIGTKKLVGEDSEGRKRGGDKKLAKSSIIFIVAHTAHREIVR
jgi:hypothetical protein